MKTVRPIWLWHAAPFLRLLLPLVAGIVFQFYLDGPVLWFALACAAAVAGWIFWFLSTLKTRYRLRNLFGLLVQLTLFTAGAFLIWSKNITHHTNWYGHFLTDSSYLVLRLAEPPVEKPKSYKVKAEVREVLRGKQKIYTKGSLLLYVAKSEKSGMLRYGDELLVQNKARLIKDNGNPGAFNYSRYAALQQLYHQAFLDSLSWIKIDAGKTNSLHSFTFNAREQIVQQLRRFIPNNQQQTGIAEALLIGYKEDLDKDLVQAYSNTGVVHIIAISGMHLGLIYVVLIWLLARISYFKKLLLARLLIVLCCIWLFTLLTGAGASVLRSAVMFTCIAVGEILKRRAAIANSIAASAFLLLCYDPFYLWDLGFQLSYMAVIGIVFLQRPLYVWLPVKNKWLDYLWKMMSVSIAAQVFTFPACIYHFHQFPNFFLVANLVAVPLSTIVLFSEIFLLIVSVVPAIAGWTGKITGLLIGWMNTIITWINNIPGSVMDRLFADVFTTYTLYALVISVTVWLLYWNKRSLYAAVFSGLLFCSLQAFQKIKKQDQLKFIVYQVPNKSAIDFVQGSRYQYRGDSSIINDPATENFYLKPSRILMQVNVTLADLPALWQKENFYEFGDKRILLVDSNQRYKLSSRKIPVDIIVISHNPAISLAELNTVFECKLYVFDSSNPLWKIDKWKHECDQLLLQHHSVPEQGAFVSAF